MSLSKVLKCQHNFKPEEIFPYPSEGFNASAQVGADSLTNLMELQGKDDTEQKAGLEFQREDCEEQIADSQVFNKEQVYNQGRQAGREEAEQEFADTVSALGVALEEIGRLRESILRNSIHDMLLLVMVIAKEVIKREVEINPDVIVSTISRALHAAVKSDEFHLRINPQDLELVNEKKPFFIASISGLQNITVETSEEVSRGGCFLESNFGEVDATIEGQLEQIREQLTAKIKGADAESG
jgi:flagellar assembly protein FliH